MPSFAQLPPDQRRRLCNEAQAKLGLHAVNVEKDFWFTVRDQRSFTAVQRTLVADG
jgi:hypothetical protein